MAAKFSVEDQIIRLLQRLFGVRGNRQDSGNWKHGGEQ